MAAEHKSFQLTYVNVNFVTGFANFRGLKEYIHPYVYMNICIQGRGINL